MRHLRCSVAVAVAVGMVLAHGTSVEAQGRGAGRSLRVPPGHMPPPGLCRVWYPGVPPGHQPPATPCGVLRGYRFVGAVVVERPVHGRAYRYWDEVWGGRGFGVRWVFRSSDEWKLEVRDRGLVVRVVDRARPGRGRRAGR